jgi:3-oxoacyl-[acyl-carrier protein] reductase
MSNFENKTAVILGATAKGGMGHGIAVDLASRGAKVVVSGRSADKAEAIAKEIGGSAFPCDVKDESQLIALTEFAAAQSGKNSIDIFVNAAAIAHAGMFSENKAHNLLDSASANLIGPMLAIRHAARFMGKGGVFLQFSSITASQPTPFTSSYSAFKAGLEQALRVAALEYGPQGIRILGIAPSIVFTPMTSFIANEQVEKVVESVTPLGRMGGVDDVVKAARFLLSGDYFETGMILPVTGGARLTRALTADEFVINEPE